MAKISAESSNESLKNKVGPKNLWPNLTQKSGRKLRKGAEENCPKKTLSET
jgi:hypothetical protein